MEKMKKKKRSDLAEAAVNISQRTLGDILKREQMIEDAFRYVAERNGLGTTLVTGHAVKYFVQAMKHFDHLRSISQQD